MDNYYVTTPIYYVNGEPHIGSAYTTILADVLSGYHRLFGDQTYFLTGTDEHGQKVETAARENSLDPLKYCDGMVEKFKNVWKNLGISNDDFIRTTEARHKSVVQKILQRIYDAGEIYPDEYEGWYCVHEERFWTEKDLVDGNCPDCNRPVSKITEKNYFFKMSGYRDWLVKYIGDHPDFIQPDFRRNEVLGFLKRPLGDLCISRPKTRLSWGIELPFDRDFVCYVWFDALINYISAVGYLEDEGKFSKWWPAVHLIGKDILTTHAVYWPCMLKAMALEQPKTIFAHGFWLSGETKMSKSFGNVVDPLDLARVYGVDAFRYFLMREMTLGQDASYTEESFISRYNSDLANDLGNLLSRVIKMLISYENGRIGQPGDPDESDIELMEKADSLTKSVRVKIETYLLSQAVEEILELVRATNRYVELNRPWDLAKQDRSGRLSAVLYNAAESLRISSILLSPIMPGKCAVIREQLGLDGKESRGLESCGWGGLQVGTRVKSGDALFPRLRKLEEVQAEKGKEIEGMIGFEEFGKVELRTAKVVSAEKVEGADKLLKLQIDLGDEKRQIVAGIAQYYAPDDMIGMNLVVVTNLKPAKIRGVESNGMLLAAQSGGDLVLLTVDKDIAPGASIS
jgi:methionyl-tRNA synthetase